MALCECGCGGCGGTVALATKNRPERGQKRGQPVRFIMGHIFHVITPKLPPKPKPLPRVKPVFEQRLCGCGCIKRNVRVFRLATIIDLFPAITSA